MDEAGDQAAWDDAFANAKYIPAAEAVAAGWTRDAAAFRAIAKGEIDVAYGDLPRERYDLFWPEGAPAGLFVFVHGGYWMSFDKSSWSHLAAGALARGWAAAVPSYPLCPEARIAEITQAVGRAVTAAARRVEGPIVLAGHSAGGHLAARLLCLNAPLSAPTQSRVRRAVALSGLFDLRPLRRTTMNATLRLDEAEALAESPVACMPAAGAELIAWVGADERPEFRRQSRQIAEIWPQHGARVGLVEDPGRHHFNVIAGLADPASLLVNRALGGPA